MNYIIFDLEFNQGFDRVNNKTISNAKCPFEIIQIGAVKLDFELNIIDTFTSNIKNCIILQTLFLKGKISWQQEQYSTYRNSV